MKDVDLREFSIIVPQAPWSESGLLDWARKMVVALTQVDAKEGNKVYTQDFASTIELSSSIANITRITITGDTTINARVGKIGPVWLVLENDSGAGHVITFGTGFRSAGTLTGTTSKIATIHFIADSAGLYEVARTTGL